MTSTWFGSEKISVTEEPDRVDRYRGPNEINTVSILPKALLGRSSDDPLPFKYYCASGLRRGSQDPSILRQKVGIADRVSSMATYTTLEAYSSAGSTLCESSLKAESMTKGNKPKDIKCVPFQFTRPDITLQIPGLVGVTSYEYERYDRRRIT